MPARAHRLDNVVLGAIEIDEDVAGVASSGERPEEDIVPLAIAQAQKSEHATMGELQGRPNLLSGKGL